LGHKLQKLTYDTIKKREALPSLEGIEGWVDAVISKQSSFANSSNEAMAKLEASDDKTVTQ
jgi:hypothetical protein